MDRYAITCLVNPVYQQYERGVGVDVKVCGLAPMLSRNYTEDTMAVARQAIRDNKLKTVEDAQQAMDIMRMGGFKVQGLFVSFDGAKSMEDDSASMENLVVDELGLKKLQTIKVNRRCIIEGPLDMQAM
ncbi:hypothetical protein DSL72_004012 [Monilinia vaccinii-corymbosi]|uniref:Uncharacterized protein n=1 Tax=Monilinia vaccinii-corymbosi TaxID=61207 RepID=A0A8A3P6T4_9HELO|nr:hypothetical protein DSL72_004012 [Monilinia vaccinii-corymbosi]